MTHATLEQQKEQEAATILFGLLIKPKNRKRRKKRARKEWKSVRERERERFTDADRISININPELNSIRLECII